MGVLPTFNVGLPSFIKPSREILLEVNLLGGAKSSQVSDGKQLSGVVISTFEAEFINAI